MNRPSRSSVQAVVSRSCGEPKRHPRSGTPRRPDTPLGTNMTTRPGAPGTLLRPTTPCRSYSPSHVAKRAHSVRIHDTGVVAQRKATRDLLEVGERVEVVNASDSTHVAPEVGDIEPTRRHTPNAQADKSRLAIESTGIPDIRRRAEIGSVRATHVLSAKGPPR